MAATQTKKAVNMALEIIAESERLMSAMYTLSALEAERAAADLTLGDFDSTFEVTGGLQHATGADLQAALTSGATFRTWAEANFHTTNWNKVRP